MQEQADAMLMLAATSRTAHKATCARSRFAILATKGKQIASINVLHINFITESKPTRHLSFLRNNLLLHNTHTQLLCHKSPKSDQVGVAVTFFISIYGGDFFLKVEQSKSGDVG